ncbi:protein of unknown function [Candidatus Nitrosacidococcus tergens]|uniref:Uncharacterized protein n=1 Tax=Candidatus Nitrosacidococcus tergens TaxID=553981 RepID=A0A7G1Q7J9_9GAMM|nr:protein of unknown function [Candidatus Nitrosacidococcus tergens]
MAVAVCNLVLITTIADSRRSGRPAAISFLTGCSQLVIRYGSILTGSCKGTCGTRAYQIAIDITNVSYARSCKR